MAPPMSGDDGMVPQGTPSLRLGEEHIFFQNHFSLRAEQKHTDNAVALLEPAITII